MIFVAAFCPVIEQLAMSIKDFPLWWALLFGACFGGNITMIGSTANIVALGMLERRGGGNITFFQWFRIGAVCTLLAGVISVGALLIFEPMMPDRPSKVKFEVLHRDSGRTFKGKKVEMSGFLAQGDFNAPKGKTAAILSDGGESRIQLLFSNDAGPLAFGKKVKLTGTLNPAENGTQYPYRLTVESFTVQK